MTTVFNGQEAVCLNTARIDHLRAQNLAYHLYKKRVLEVGAGIGHLTSFFEHLECEIVSTDGRRENVNEHLRRYPGRDVRLVDLLAPNSHGHLGEFDVVFCYGTLYHIGAPLKFIKDMSEVCTGILLLETLVSPTDNHRPNTHIEQWGGGRDQSLDTSGCLPAKSWVKNALKKYFEYVHEAGSPAMSREVFIASRFKLEER